MTTLHPSAIALDFGQARRAIELALRLGDAGAAWRAAHALLRCCPEAVAPLALLGHALLEAGNVSVAADYLRRALRLSPLDAAAWGALAGALASQGRHAAAAAALRRAATHDPLGAESLAPGVADAAPLAEGVYLLRRGMPDLAAAELALAVAHHPRRDDLRAHYAEALRRCGDLPAARRELAMLDRAGAETLPALMLRTALAPDDDATNLRARCFRLDPDGALTRRFFAPEPPPWSLVPAPDIPWSEDFEPLAPFLGMKDEGRGMKAVGSAFAAPKRYPTIPHDAPTQTIITRTPSSPLPHPLSLPHRARPRGQELSRHRRAAARPPGGLRQWPAPARSGEPAPHPHAGHPELPRRPPTPTR